MRNVEDTPLLFAETGVYFRKGRTSEKDGDNSGYGGHRLRLTFQITVRNIFIRAFLLFPNVTQYVHTGCIAQAPSAKRKT